MRIIKEEGIQTGRRGFHNGIDLFGCFWIGCIGLCNTRGSFVVSVLRLSLARCFWRKSKRTTEGQTFLYAPTALPLCF